MHFGLLKASDMILVDLDGKVIGGNRSRCPNAAGFRIHAAVHKARADVMRIPFMGRRGRVSQGQHTCKFYNAQSVYDSYGGVVLAAEEGDCIAEALGSGKGRILMNHGLLTVGGTVDEPAFLFGSTELSYRVQLLAEAAAANGMKTVVISDEEAACNFKMEK